MIPVELPSTLYHYTCLDHGGAKIGNPGVLKPGQDGVVWLTDLDVPIISALGMTPVMAKCDRSELRYRVDDTSEVFPWMVFRRTVSFELRTLLEGFPGAMPRHWFVSLDPVAAVLDPL